MCWENVHTYTCWKVRHMFYIIMAKYKSLTIITTIKKTIQREMIQAFFTRVDRWKPWGLIFLCYCGGGGFNFMLT